jgi:transcriptional regulator with GAF, ATPase, and Fis domain
LTGEKYSKSIGSMMIAIVLGTVGGVFLDKQFETNRYPINIEYNIINNCLSAYEKPLRREYYEKKRKVCICALKETEGNQTKTAQILGTTKRIIQYKIQKYNIDYTKFKTNSQL